jgi:hypothetical protein
MLRLVLGHRTGFLLLVLAACSHQPPTPKPLAQTAPPEPWPTSDEAAALARAFYGSLGVIHATADEPDANDTPLLASLRPCQIEPARPLEHPGFRKFFPQLRFFVSSCGDGSYAVVSIDAQRNVQLVSLEPHERLPATAWDDPTSGTIVIDKLDDIRLFGSAYGALMYLETVAPADFTVRESLGTDQFAGTHYYEVHASTFDVTLESKDRRHYSVAGNERRLNVTSP